METIKLKNGTEEAKPLVAVTMLVLRDMFDTAPIEAYELVCLARDPKHVPFGDCGGSLVRRMLVEQRVPGGALKVPTSIRNIVLSAVSGEGLDMVLGNPWVS